jgi:hypothetical protein
MTQHIALIRNGVVENIIVSEPEFAGTLGYDVAIPIDGYSPMPGISWKYSNEVFTPPAPVINSRMISKVQYLNRFPDQKLSAIYAATVTDPNLQLIQAKFDATVDEVNLDDPTLVQALSYFVFKGYLTQADVDVIRA